MSGIRKPDIANPSSESLGGARYLRSQGERFRTLDIESADRIVVYRPLPVALLLTSAPPPPVRVSTCTVKG